MNNTIVHGDVLDVARRIRSESVDLVIADPPYGIRKDFGMPDSFDDLDTWIAWCRQWLEECKRILKPHGSMIVYGIHNYQCFVQVELYKMELLYVRQLIWHYENGFCGNRVLPRATYEPILWFSKQRNFYFEPIREPYKSTARLKYKVNKRGRTWTPHPDGRIAGDVWAFPTLAGRRFRDEKIEHPTQKPLSLTDRIVRHMSPEGGLVYVPFVGSGSECVSAYALNRKFIGSEINEMYCKMAQDRLAALDARSNLEVPELEQA